MQGQQRGGERPCSGRILWDDIAFVDTEAGGGVWIPSGMKYCSGTDKTVTTGGKSCFREHEAVGADFEKTLRTARGFGFGFTVLSSKEIRIPRNIRKKMTATVVEVMNSLFLVIIQYFIFIISCSTCQYIRIKNVSFSILL